MKTGALEIKIIFVRLIESRGWSTLGLDNERSVSHNGFFNNISGLLCALAEAINNGGSIPTQITFIFASSNELLAATCNYILHSVTFNVSRDSIKRETKNLRVPSPVIETVNFLTNSRSSFSISQQNQTNTVIG